MTTETVFAPPMRSLNEDQLKRLYFDFIAYRDSNGGYAGMSVQEFYQREWRRYA